MSKDRQIGRPNILLIVTDDQPHETGWATRKISNWNAGRGVNFANGFVTTPLCLPSGASIFTGRCAHNHGVLDNRDPLAWTNVPPCSTTCGARATAPGCTASS